MVCLGDMSESCRPIQQEKLAKIDPNHEEPALVTTDRLASGFLIAVGLLLVAVALFFVFNLTSQIWPANALDDEAISQTVPSAPSIQTAYENQPANNPILGN